MATAQSKYSLAPIQSSYVDPGTVQVASILRQRYDENKAKHDTITRAAKNLKVGGGDQHLKDSALQGIQDGISRTVAGNNFEASGGIIDDLATGFATNEGLQVATESYNKREAELAYQAEMTAKGMQFLDFNAIRDEDGIVVGHAFDTHQSYWTDENGEVHKQVYQNGVETQLDYSKKMQQLIGTIAKSGHGLTRLEGEFAGLLQYSRGVSQRKADSVASGLFDTYMESDEGIQQMRKLTEIDGLSAEEAQAKIISDMQAVAQPQVGMIPQWMTDPQYAGSQAEGNGNAMTLPSDAYKKEGMDGFTNVQENIKTLTANYREETDPAKKEVIRNQINASILNLENSYRTAAASSSDPKVKEGALRRAELFSGENFKYITLASFFEGLTTDEWQLSSDDVVSATNQNIWDNVGRDWIARTPFRNVSDALVGEGRERDRLKNMFNTEGIQILNETFGLNLDESDIPKMQELVDDVYTYMDTGGGEEYRDFVQETIAIQEDDRIAFAPAGATELRKVNTVLAETNLSDFDFLTVDGSVLSADEIAATRKKLEERKEDLTFQGLVMPNIWTGTQPSLFLELDGVRIRAIPKDSGSFYAPPLMNRIADSLGLGQVYTSADAQVSNTLAGNESNQQRMDTYTSGLQLDVLRDMPGYEDALASNTTSDWLNANIEAPYRTQIARKIEMDINLRDSMLRSVGMMANVGWSEQKLRELDAEQGTAEELARFDETVQLWLSLPFQF